jgi:hypothetical protein
LLEELGKLALVQAKEAQDARTSVNYEAQVSEIIHARSSRHFAISQEATEAVMAMRELQCLIWRGYVDVEQSRQRLLDYADQIAGTVKRMDHASIGYAVPDTFAVVTGVTGGRLSERDHSIVEMAINMITAWEHYAEIAGLDRSSPSDCLRRALATGRICRRSADTRIGTEAPGNTAVLAFVSEHAGATQTGRNYIQLVSDALPSSITERAVADLAVALLFQSSHLAESADVEGSELSQFTSEIHWIGQLTKVLNNPNASQQVRVCILGYTAGVAARQRAYAMQ